MMEKEKCVHWRTRRDEFSLELQRTLFIIESVLMLLILFHGWIEEALAFIIIIILFFCFLDFGFEFVFEISFH